MRWGTSSRISLRSRPRADFKRLLNVTSVGDKADIYAKFQRLVDARMKDTHPTPGGNSDEKQDEADTVAVYAAAAAGYRPQAYGEFWDRMFFVKGKVGGRLSDFFGVTRPESTRLRAILKLVTALPQGCGGTQPNDSAEFENWHTLVVANQPGTLTSDTKPLMQSALTPPLRMDLEQLRFSRDGKYILAQDETSIFVLNREPYQPLFRFDAEDALPAEFTPDSQRIVFHTRGLHTEEWSIADRKLMASHEPLSQHDCIQTKLSPDGRTLFCVSIRTDEFGWNPGPDCARHGDRQCDLREKGLFHSDLRLSGQALYERTVRRRRQMSCLAAFRQMATYLLIGPGNDKLAFDLRTRAACS